MICFTLAEYMETIVAKLVLVLTFSHCSFGNPPQELFSLTYLIDYFNSNYDCKKLFGGLQRY